MDFEELAELSSEREEDIPEEVIWIAIEQKHQNRIARLWTLFSIFAQVTTFIVIIAIYCYISLINFAETKAELTPIFYIGNDRTYHFYFSVMLKNRTECKV